MNYRLILSLLLVGLTFLANTSLAPFKKNCWATSSPIARAAFSSPLQKKILEHLREIYQEVKEMGPYPGENFIKQEFFIEIDGDRTNKEEQVVVLIQPQLKLEKMLIQITTFSAPKVDTLRLAVSTKKISCALFQKDLALTGSDYSDEQTCQLLEAILKGIRQEKKLLNLIKNKKKKIKISFGPS